MDQADKVYRHAEMCRLKAETVWGNNLTREELKSVRDQAILAEAEATGIRAQQKPRHWSDLYKTEEERWRTSLTLYERETWSSAFKEKLLLTWVWCSKSIKDFIDKTVGIKYIGKGLNKSKTYINKNSESQTRKYINAKVSHKEEIE